MAATAQDILYWFRNYLNQIPLPIKIVNKKLLIQNLEWDTSQWQQHKTCVVRIDRQAYTLATSLRNEMSNLNQINEKNQFCGTKSSSKYRIDALKVIKLKR